MALSVEVFELVRNCSKKGLINGQEARLLKQVISMGQPEDTSVTADDPAGLAPLQQLDVMITNAYDAEQIDQSKFAQLTQLEKQLAIALQGLDTN